MAETRDGGCHCEAVRFRIRTDGVLASASRCNCSICRMRGAVAVTVPLGEFEILQGEDRLTRYSFNTRVAQHYFCSICGIYTHHQRRSNPEEYGVNAACLDGVSPFDFAAIPVGNGVRHSLDEPDAPRRAGTLRFEPSGAAASGS